MFEQPDLGRVDGFNRVPLDVLADEVADVLGRRAVETRAFNLGGYELAKLWPDRHVDSGRHFAFHTLRIPPGLVLSNFAQMMEAIAGSVESRIVLPSRGSKQDEVLRQQKMSRGRSSSWRNIKPEVGIREIRTGKTGIPHLS